MALITTPPWAKLFPLPPSATITSNKPSPIPKNSIGVRTIFIPASILVPGNEKDSSFGRVFGAESGTLWMWPQLGWLWLCICYVLPLHSQSIVSVAVGLHVIADLLGTTLSFHRNTSHRSFKLPKWLEYFFPYCGVQALQGNPIDWASTHRLHHRKRTPQPPRRILAQSHELAFRHQHYN